jgi:predicted ATPase
VFVSSTLKELAPERRAVRAAVERLHLAPVMFELGARPHPPRALYRSYLSQSDVFVGLYWERYGWVAPGEEVSGLEDEYRLVPPGMPRLVYVKEATGAREPRLVGLLDRIRSDDTASYTSFTDADALGELVTADLAVLLAERFDASRAPRAVPTGDAAPAGTATTPADDLPAEDHAALPTPPTPLVGREREVADVLRLLDAGTGAGGRTGGAPVRMLTITGPGGIGKSRLALEVASRLRAAFADDVHFVDLTPVHDPGLVPGAIAHALGVRDTGDGPIVDKLGTALRERRMLLVLDNLEQVADAGPFLAGLLAGSPGLVLLQTSRALLRVSPEHSYELGPLAMPGRRADLDAARAAPAVALFVERARALRPDFDVTAANVDAVVAICAALDAVPLAIELAAARVRVLPPVAMLARLDRRLPLLTGGGRDLPERQQTLRRTIEWSVDLLDDAQRALLATLGVFDGPFTLDAVEDVGGADDGADTLTLLGALVDSSLVRQRDEGDGAQDLSSFTMLATVREHARERLAAEGRLDAARERHAEHYERLGREAGPLLLGPGLRTWTARLALEDAELRATARHLLDRGEHDRAAAFAWSLYTYWWVGGRLGEVRRWMDEVLDAPGDVAPRTRATALYFTRAITFWQDPDDLVVPGLTESAELFRAEHDPWGEALALVSLALARLTAATPDPGRAAEALGSALALFRGAGSRWGEAMTLVTQGRVAILQGRVPDAAGCFEESLAAARQVHDPLGEAIALHHLGWALLLLGRLPEADADFRENLRLSARLGHDDGVAYGLEGLVAVAASAGDAERAGTLLGAAEALREQTGLYNAPTFSFHLLTLDRVLDDGARTRLEAARAAGRALPVADAVGLALDGSAASARAPGGAP